MKANQKIMEAKPPDLQIFMALEQGCVVTSPSLQPVDLWYSERGRHKKPATVSHCPVSDFLTWLVERCWMLALEGGGGRVGGMGWVARVYSHFSQLASLPGHQVPVTF